MSPRPISDDDGLNYWCQEADEKEDKSWSRGTFATDDNPHPYPTPPPPTPEISDEGVISSNNWILLEKYKSQKGSRPSLLASMTAAVPALFEIQALKVESAAKSKRVAYLEVEKLRSWLGMRGGVTVI